MADDTERQSGKTVIVPTPGQSLDSYLTTLIAAHENVPPALVTVEYIRAAREKRHYPNTRYGKGSKYGGYSTAGLIVRSQEERRQIREQAEMFLTEIG